MVTPSHVRRSRVPGKVDTPKPRCIGARTTCPDEIKIRDRTSGRTIGVGELNAEGGVWLLRRPLFQGLWAMRAEGDDI
ncbi:hypothetical protein CRG98_046317 [Punica granatum]|uniref:Uncharacterized protein n=1 Tax=Punica granatum TaxID=22663 RepID=A0A2I0HNJ8_PUNGR|nr:hypothetical protein CRG98_046317 [Punica granatum]